MKMRIALTLLAMLAIPCFALSQSFEWERLPGPYGGDVGLYAMTRDTIFATARMGIYRSDAGGSSWIGPFRVDNSDTVQIHSVFGTLEKTILAYTKNGIYRSLDKGMTWGTTSLKKMWIWCITQTPNGDIFAGSDSGIYRSSDDGVDWRKIGGKSVSFLLATNEGTLLADNVSSYDGMYRSTNGGISWTTIYGERNYVTGLVKDNEGNLYVSAYTLPPNGGPIDIRGWVARSSNDGQSWEKKYETKAEIAYVIACAAHDTLYIRKGFSDFTNLYSTDKGNTWKVLPVFSNQYFNSLLPTGNAVLLSVYDNVFRFYPKDETLELSQQGITSPEIYSGQVNGDTIRTYSSSSIYSVSIDKGVTWKQQYPAGGWPLFLDSSGAVWAGFDQMLPSGDSVWTPLPEKLSVAGTIRSSLFLENGDILLTAQNGVFIHHPDSSLQKLSDMPDLYHLQHGNGNVYFAYDLNNRTSLGNYLLYVSRDGCATWDSIPGARVAVFTATPNGIVFGYARTDLSATPLLRIDATAGIIDTVPNILDPNSASVPMLLRTLGSTTFICLIDSIHFTSDNGNMWTVIPSMGRFSSVGRLVDIAADDRGYLYGFTLYGGTYRSKNPIILNTEQPITPIPSGFTLGAIYPQPAYTSVAVPITLSWPLTLTVELYSVLGKKLSERTVSYTVPGTFEQHVNVSGLPSGTYRLLVRSSAQVQNVPVIIVR